MFVGSAGQLDRTWMALGSAKEVCISLTKARATSSKGNLYLWIELECRKFEKLASTLQAWEGRMKDIAVVSYCRTGIAKAGRGALNQTHGIPMAAHVLRNAVERARIDPGEVEDVILGCG